MPFFRCLAILFLFTTGCGYTLQQTENPLLSRHGVRRIYIAPLINDSYKPGVENVVYNELVKAIGAQGRVQVVDRAELADAVLNGSISQATYSRSASTTADQLFPTAATLTHIERPSSNIAVATEYGASLSTSFVLSLREPKPGQRSNLWSGSFSRSQTFPGNNQLGPFGTTGHLINDSEFDRALRELAISISGNLQESMLAMF
jgi:hypothetical protein